MAVSNKMVELTDDAFDQDIGEHKGLAIVDFWATWCGPCQIIAPVIEQLAQEYEGKLRVGKLDVDANQQTAIRFNVRSIPSILFFKDGALVDTIVGAVPKAALVDKIESHL
jgi:thioredoxin 1